MKRIKNFLNRILENLLKRDFIYFLFRPTRPLSRKYGFDRGKPIDRAFIEQFLSENSGNITGAVLEIKDDNYTKRFGRNVVRSDVLDIDKRNEVANIYADLRHCPEIPDSSYDCIILTQVLQFVDEYEKAISELLRILKPKGALLATLPAMSRIDVAAGIGRDYWRWTPAGAEFIFRKYFSEIEVKSFGNVPVGIGFWAGEASEDLNQKKIGFNDPNFPVLVAIKAIK